MSNLIVPENENNEQSVREWIADINPDAIMATGYDNCIIGISRHGNIIYSVDMIINTLVGMEHEWSHEDAIEWFEFNIQGSFTGKKNEPIFVQTNYTYYMYDYSN